MDFNLNFATYIISVISILSNVFIIIRILCLRKILIGDTFTVLLIIIITSTLYLIGYLGRLIDNCEFSAIVRDFFDNSVIFWMIILIYTIYHQCVFDEIKKNSKQWIKSLLITYAIPTILAILQ